MKDIQAFLSALDDMGIELRSEKDRLHCNAPRGVLTQSLRAELAQRKAEILSALHGRQAAGDTIYPVSRDRDLPLSFAQRRLWFLEQMEKGSPAYNMPSALRLRGPLDLGALRRSITEIVRRHEILRTTFPVKHGSPVQSISPPSEVNITTLDLRHLTEPERSSRVRVLADEEAQRPFDLAKGPLMRVTLLELEAGTHVLLLTMHHILTDGWSSGIFVRELSALYNAFSAGSPSSLPEPPLQYADFACWQLDRLQGKIVEEQLRFWKGLLTEAPGVLELPSYRPRPAVQTFRGRSESVQIEADLKQALADLSRQSGATLFMTLLTAFATLLFRYCGQSDLLVGTPIANRNRAEIEEMIGFFANTLALRFTFSDNPGFQKLLSRVREMMMAAYEYQDLPFERLVEELHPDRDLSRNPLVQVVFALQNAPMHSLTPEVRLHGLEIEPVAFESGTVRLDLEVHLWEVPTGLRGDFIYNTDLFEADVIARMAGNYRTLLQSIVADPNKPVSELPLLTAQERHRVLVTWNDTDKAYADNHCLHHAVEKQAQERPESTALICEGRSMTYRELNARANQLAHHLRRLGVGPDVPVGICMERSLDMIVGLLGILKAGGAYVPLDPTYPRDRLAFMMEDSQAPLLVSQSPMVESFSSFFQLRSPVLCLDTDWETICLESEENPVSETRSQNLAYVIYTSGSTGRPKGVQIAHRSVINLLEAVHPVLHISDEDIWTVFHSYAFDLSVWEIWSPLYSGGRLVIVPYQTTKSPHAFYDLLSRERVTVLNQTPSFMGQLIHAKQYTTGPAKAEALPSSIRLLICGGEALPHKMAGRLLHAGVSLWNFYGPTEATVWTVIKPVLSVEGGNGTVPIGRPIANTQVYLLSPDLQPVPIGVKGELCIAGECLARGYLNRSELTAEKFVPNPFKSTPGARLYKTGDVARYLPNGEIEFFGRKDHQVKVRGYRIELEEIETVLAEHPGVREAVVLLREDYPGDLRLVAYVVVEGREPPSSALRDWLKEKLPASMMPSDIVILEALPLTPNGKVSRRDLPAPDPKMSRSMTTYAAPRNETERSIAAIWQEVLHVEKAGIHDNFFDLGGHSFLMIQVHTKLRDIHGMDIQVLDLFRYPTIAALARFLGEGQETTTPVFGQIRERARKQKMAIRLQKGLKKQRSIVDARQ